MPIKIKLPHNVRVTCPTPETAITILRSITFRTAHAEMSSLGQPSYPNSQHARPFTGPPSVPSGRPFEGEGFMAAVVIDDHDDIIVDAENIENDIEEQEEEELGPTEEDEEIVEAEFANGDEEEHENEEQEEDDLRTPSDASSEIPEVEHPDESEIIDAEVQEFQQYQDEWKDEEDDEPNIVDEMNDRKRTTRSRLSGELETHNIFQPIEYRAKDCTRRVFDFIQGRLMFTTKDVKKYAKEELSMKMSDENKKKIKDSLKILRKAGLIEKCHHGQWRKVS